MPQIHNSFVKGQQGGVADEAADNLAARELHNFRFLESAGGAYVLTTVRGNAHRGDLPAGMRLAGHGVYGGVAYLVLHDDATGETELGSFPSPDGERLAYAYAPLRNFRQPDGTYGAFRTAAFGHHAATQVQVRLQPDYDGSVNLVLNDAEHLPLLVNSGFSVVDGRVQEVDRSGQHDTNRYDEGSFSDRLPLLQRSTKILRLDFLGVTEGGRVKAGNYHYYFRYGTADGNVTDIAAESLAVLVAHGTTVASSRGGRGDGEETAKAVHFRLGHLDRAYSHLHVFFVHATGETDTVRSAYRIEQPLLLGADEVSFTHTGFEDVQRIDLAELAVEMPRIARVGTVEQAGGHLMLGDIQEKGEDYGLLESFARRLVLGFTQAEIPAPGVEENLTAVYGTPLAQGQKANAWGWAGGYANPMNVYHGTGYMGGESYAIAARFLFPDGTLSPAFPLLGCDQLGNDVPGGELLGLSFDEQGLAAGTARMANIRGIFRFPARNAAGQADGQSLGALFEQGAVRALALTVTLPPLADEEYAAVRARTVGLQLVRAERKPDRLAQGLLVPTYSVPSADMTHRVWDSDPDKKLWGWFNLHTGSDLPTTFSEDYWTGDKRRVVPLPAGEIEGAVWHYDTADAQKEHYGVFTARLWDGFADHRRYGLYSLDVMADPLRLANTLNNREVSVDVLAEVTFRRSLLHANAHGGQNATLLQPMLIVRNQLVPVQAGTAHYVPEGSDRVLTHSGGFGSYIGRLNLEQPGGTNYVKAERVIFGEYLGLHLPEATRAYLTTVAQGSVDAVRNPPVAPTQRLGRLVNLHAGGTGPLAREAVWASHRNVDANAYFPITPRLYWDDAAGADPARTVASHSVGGKLVAFGGDCFVGFGYRRLFFGDERTDGQDAAELVGRGIALCQESAFNMYARTEERALETEPDPRSFFPFYRHKDADKKLFWRRNKYPEAVPTNLGYAKTGGDRGILTLPQGVPFLGTRWFSRVIASGKHIPNAFANGYRVFSGLAMQDYESEHGPIRLLQVVGGRLLAFFEHAIGIIPVNERVQTGSDSAGAIFVEGAGLLSPQLGLITREYGAPQPFAVAVTDNYAYVPVPDKAVILRVRPELAPAEILSDVAVSPWLHGLRQRGGARVVSLHDRRHGELLFTFHPHDPALAGFTLAFAEKVSALLGEGPVWAGFRGLRPQAGFLLGDDRLYTLPATAPAELWEQDQGPYCAFYGEQHAALARFVTNPQAGREVVYCNQAVESSHLLPASATYQVTGGRSHMDVVYDPADPVVTNAKRVRGTTWLVLPVVHELNESSTGAWELPEADSSGAEFAVGSRLRGKQLETTLRWESPLRLTLNRVTTYTK